GHLAHTIGARVPLHQLHRDRAHTRPVPHLGRRIRARRALPCPGTLTTARPTVPPQRPGHPAKDPVVVEKAPGSRFRSRGPYPSVSDESEWLGQLASRGPRGLAGVVRVGCGAGLAVCDGSGVAVCDGTGVGTGLTPTCLHSTTQVPRHLPVAAQCLVTEPSRR